MNARDDEDEIDGERSQTPDSADEVQLVSTFDWLPAAASPCLVKSLLACQSWRLTLSSDGRGGS